MGNERLHGNGSRKWHTLSSGILSVVTAFTIAAASIAADLPARAAQENPEPVQYAATVGEEGGSLAVTATADAGSLPDGAVLNVRKITKEQDPEQYEEVEKQVRGDAAQKDRELAGFLAYDISFTVNKGTAYEHEVEPDGSVRVSMEWSEPVRPETSKKADGSGGSSVSPSDLQDSDVSVLHLKEDGSGSVTEVVDLTEDGDAANGEEKNGKGAESDTTQTGAAVSTDTDHAVQAVDLKVDSFSVFTITWTKGSSGSDSGTRVGNVTLHYVDENGLEIDRTETLSANELKKTAGDVVNISAWVNDTKDSSGAVTRKVSGYTFVKAALGGISGPRAAAVKVASSGSSGYRLYYTSSTETVVSDSDWKPFSDYVSKEGSNNADLYLIFRSTAQRVRVHYVDETGNILINPTYKYADAVYSESAESGNVNQTGINIGGWAESIPNYTFSGRAHMGGEGWKGFSFQVVRAQRDSQNIPEGENDQRTYRFQYKLKTTDADWTDLTATDVYLIYTRTDTSIKRKVTIHYLDTDGNVIADNSGNVISQTVDAADWGNDVQQDLTNRSRYAIDLDGYTFTSSVNDGNQNNSRTIIGTPNAADLTFGSGSAAVDATSSVITMKPAGGNEPQSTSIKGNTFHYIRYVYTDSNRQGTAGTFYVGRNDSKGKINWYAVAGDFDIYLTYQKNAPSAQSYTYTVHYVDGRGEQIAPASSRQTIATSGSIMKVSLTDLVSGKGSIAGYTAETEGLLGRPTEAEGGIPFTSIDFTKQTDGSGRWTGKWTYTVNGNGSGGGGKPPEHQLNLENINLYVVYNTSDALRLHFVDLSGTPLSDNIVKTHYSSVKNGIILQPISRSDGGKFTLGYGNVEGYSYREIRVGSFDHPAGTVTNNLSKVQIQYTVSGSGGSSALTSTYTDDGGQQQPAANLIHDVYLVYQKNDSTLNIHYVYITKENLLSRLDGGRQDQTGAVPGTRSSQTSLSDGANVKSFEGKIHIGTRLGPKWSNSLSGADLGPYVDRVYTEDGQLKYTFSNEQEPYSLARQGNNDVWIYAAPSGRRFVLEKENDGDYVITDSQHGTFELNLRSDNTYTASFHGEAETTEYTVVHSVNTVNNSGENGTLGTTAQEGWKLTLRDWIPDNQNNIYELYIDDDSSGAKVWIDDDMEYSGYFTVGRNSWIESRMQAGYPGSDGITNYWYEWQRIVTGSSETGTAGDTTASSTVERKQTGIHWNMAYSRSDRTWLDVEADDGGLNETTQKAVRYKVIMHYQLGTNGDWKTAESTPIAVNYYSQLMNGSFESPSILPGDSGYQKTQNYGHFYSNAVYKSDHGVWQTTSPGTGSNANSDIEIINVHGNNNQTDTVHYTQADKTSYGWNPDLPFEAADGNQFAELNAESAGALYQDVVTHPDQRLNYWLSHRARGNWPRPGGSMTGAPIKAGTPEYDTMYLVIMPTKLAMTAASSGGELKNQTDLENFIRKHGGYDSDLATGVGQEVTYRDETNGILIVKVDSNDQFWHSIYVPNGYVAKAGLTRFFFVAGPQSYSEKSGDENTHGNFIDAVGFSQSLPVPKGFNLVVSKTFRGLSDAQLAGLAGTFRIAISNKHIDSSMKEDSGAANDSLNGAALGFTASEKGGVYTFTPTAVMPAGGATSGTSASGTDLLVGSNTGTVHTNADGSITMTWSFVDQPFRTTDNDQTFDYYASEGGDSVNGFILTSKQAVSGENSNYPGAALVYQGATAAFELENTYAGSINEHPQIIVSKTFYGLTPAAVDTLFASGYQLIVTKNGSGAERKVLTANTEALDANVTFTRKENAENKSTTVRWIISGWSEGTYSVRETGYNSGNAAVTGISVNGEKVEGENGQPPAPEMVKENIEVGKASAAVLERMKMLSFDSSAQYEKKVPDSSASGTSGCAGTYQLSRETNLIAARYEMNNKIYYVVWTPDPIGTNVRDVVLDYLNGEGGWNQSADSNKATLDNTDFRSSANPGKISIGTGSISYDSDAGSLRLSQDSGNFKWTKLYSTKVTGVNAADLEVENSYNPIIRVRKTETGGPTKVLGGAEFRLFRKDNSGNPQYWLQNRTWGGGKTAAQIFTTSDGTDGNTEGEVRLPFNLSTGTYYLEETRAPQGYGRITKPVSFAIDDNGAVSLGTASPDVDNSHALVSSGTLSYVIIISDDLFDKTVTEVGKGSLNENGRKALAQIGTSVAYKSEFTVPADLKSLKFTDTLDPDRGENEKRLLLNQGSIVVQLNGTVVDAGSYTLTAGDYSIELVFNTDYVSANLKKGSVIRIAYRASITGNALAGDPADNTAEISYGTNNPQYTSTVSVDPNNPELYNAVISVRKVDRGGNPVSGAGFVLRNGEGKYYKKTETGGSRHLPAVTWVDSIDDADEFRTAGTGDMISFDGLADGTYTLIENTVPSGYLKASDQKIVIEKGDYSRKNLEQTVTVTNYRPGEPENPTPDHPRPSGTIDIPVTKEWSDDNNKDGIRPESVTVVLIENRNNKGRFERFLVLSESNNWTAAFTDLPLERDGKTIAYSIHEDAVPGYETSVAGDVSTGFVVTNHHTPGEPVNPTPDQPDGPPTPDQPVQPTPDNPEPDNPLPDQPGHEDDEVPSEPGTPSNPDTPSEPGNPALPHEPGSVTPHENVPATMVRDAGLRDADTNGGHLPAAGTEAGTPAAPETGDDGRMALYGASALVSGAALAAWVVLERKRKAHSNME